MGIMKSILVFPLELWVKFYLLGFLSLGQQSCQIDMIVKGLGKCGLLKILQKDFLAKAMELNTNFFLIDDNHS
jgi:hypothetical protein